MRPSRMMRHQARRLEIRKRITALLIAPSLADQSFYAKPGVATGKEDLFLARFPVNTPSPEVLSWRRGRVAEGGGLLNRCTA